jgi:hypothetical protein
MRIVSRTIGLTVAALMLSLVLAIPASAGQLIKYEGEQSTGEPVRARVLQRDSGRRFLLDLGFSRVDVVCEDGSSATWDIRFDFTGRRSPGHRVDGGRALDQEYKSGSVISGVSDLYARVTGAFRWAAADGTLIFSVGALTEDGSDSQLCTSGEITWTAERTSATPARLTAGSVPDGVGFIKFQATGRGELEVARIVQP